MYMVDLTRLFDSASVLYFYRVYLFCRCDKKKQVLNPNWIAFLLSLSMKSDVLVTQYAR